MGEHDHGCRYGQFMGQAQMRGVYVPCSPEIRGKWGLWGVSTMRIIDKRGKQTHQTAEAHNGTDTPEVFGENGREPKEWEDLGD